MPLNQSQIEKLKSIPNRINIFGYFTENLLQAQRKNSKTMGRFIDEYKEEIKRMPLSSLRNDLLIPLANKRWDFSVIFDITPDRVVAGFVTSGTGVLTNQLATDCEMIFIEDETGSIGVIIDNSLVGTYIGGVLHQSYGTANSNPISNNSDQIGKNLPANDYRHNIRIGDLMIIQRGRYNPVSPSVIQAVSQYLIDSEFRGVSPIPYGLGYLGIPPGVRGRDLLGERLNPFGDRVNSNTIDYNLRTQQSDNRLFALAGKFVFVEDLEPKYPPLSGKDISFLPNKFYLIKTDSRNAQINTYRGRGLLRVVISQTSELARFRVKIPIGEFNYISGIVMQDHSSDERFLFPRFLGDIYIQGQI